MTGLAIVLMAMLMPTTPQQPEEAQPAQEKPGSQATHAPQEADARALWRQPLRTKAVFGSAAVASLLVAVYLWSGGEQAGRLVSADRLGDSGLYAQSLALSRTVTEEPARAGALETVGYDLQDMGELPQANRALARAVAANPSDWTLRLSWAAALLNLGQRARARAQVQEAVRLNPFIRDGLPGLLSTLDSRPPA